MTPAVVTEPGTTRSDYLWLDVTMPEDARLAFISHRAASQITATQRLDVRIDAVGDATRVRAGSADAVVGTDRRVGELVYGAVHDRVVELARADGWIRLHMALIQMHGRRIGIAGGSGAGKSTTVIAAALRGADVHGDEVVFARDGYAIALPRPLHLKQGTMGLFPALHAHAQRLDYSPPVHVLDPAAMGWSPIANSIAPLDILVLLEPSASEGHGVVSPSMPDALVQLMPDAAAFDPDHSRVVAEVTGLLSSTRIVGMRRDRPERMSETLGCLALA